MNHTTNGIPDRHRIEQTLPQTRQEIITLPYIVEKLPRRRFAPQSLHLRQSLLFGPCSRRNARSRLSTLSGRQVHLIEVVLENAPAIVKTDRRADGTKHYHHHETHLCPEPAPHRTTDKHANKGAHLLHRATSFRGLRSGGGNLDCLKALYQIVAPRPLR